MSKLKDIVAKAIEANAKEIEGVAKGALEAVAKSPSVSAPKATKANLERLKGFDLKAQRIGEIGFIAKHTSEKLYGSELSAKNVATLDSRFKAVGVTTDIADLLPSGFTGALFHDIQERLVVTSLFPYKEVAPGQYDSISLHGITGYLVAENNAGTESSESYTNMIYLVEKCMATVKKSYEALDDALINLAEEVRMGIVDALARAIESAVINGDNTATHMDNATVAAIGANDFRRAFKGLRKLALGKTTVDFGGAALTEAEWLAKISVMQETGGVYTDELEVARGNVVLIVDQTIYNIFRGFTAFLTKEKAGVDATLFGAPVATVFGIPVIMTPFIPKVTDTGVVGDGTLGFENDMATFLMVNTNTCRYFTTGAPLMESDKDIGTQFVSYVGSVRVGFNSVYDRDSANPDTISAVTNIVAAINVPRA